MIFRPMFEPHSGSCHHFSESEETGKAILTDAIISSMNRDLAGLQRCALQQAFNVDMHGRASRTTAALKLTLPEHPAGYCQRWTKTPQG